MSRWVVSLGLTPRVAGSADEAMQALAAEPCELAIIDLMMPGKNGLWLARELRKRYPDIAVILATGVADDLDTSQAALADLLVKPFRRDRFILAVDRGRQWRRDAEETAWHAQLTTELEERFAELVNDFSTRLAAGDNPMEWLLALAQTRTPDVAAHAERVARYTIAIATELGVDSGEIDMFERAAQLHDIGKAAIPEAVLTKPSPLTRGEAEVMKHHVDAGADLVCVCDALRPLEPAIRASHEWFGGGGYPGGLSGSSIPLASRIIAVADAYDAMTQDRRYRSRLDGVEAAAELLRGVPAQFDPDIVSAFLNMLNRH